MRSGHEENQIHCRMLLELPKCTLTREGKNKGQREAEQWKNSFQNRGRKRVARNGREREREGRG